jgi:hypothetical protein
MPPRPFSSSVLPARRPVSPRAQGGISSLLRLGAATLPHPAPATLSPRPFVLGRPHAVPQQMSLFGPRGASR